MCGAKIYYEAKDGKTARRIEKIKVLQARKKKMAAQAIAAQRKSRNHRLFKLGAIVEKTLERNITDEDIGKFETFLTGQERCGKQLSKVVNNDCDAD